MIPTHQFIKQVGDFDIFLRQPGFESIPNSFGKVASFILRKEDFTAVFAFAYSGLDALQDPSFNESQLLTNAIIEIEKFIKNGKVKGNEEYTFEYKNKEFSIVNNPSWWVKSPSPSPSA